MADSLALVFMNTTVFVDNRRPFIDEETFTTLMLVNPAIITMIISMIGLGTNTLTIVTFVKMGFKETINVSLVTLAVTDLISSLFLIVMSLSYNPAFCGPVCDIIDLRQLEDFILCDPRSYFTTVSGWITALIACERCLCVLRPLQVKMLVTKSRIRVIMPIIFVVSIMPFIPLLYTTGIDWLFYPERNRSILSRTSKEHLYHVDVVSYGLVMALNFLIFALVTVFTTLIVTKLASQSNWRSDKEGAGTQGSGKDSDDKDGDKKKGLSGRDKRAAMTVTLIAVMYIVCNFPGRILYLAMSLSEEFNKGMLYTNLYDFLWYFAYIFEAFCSTANIIVYLKSSTKFKEAFLGLFGKGSATDQQRRK